jgi:precorrin-2 dehydrogenase/sirohydrochlorin ferrochelatase
VSNHYPLFLNVADRNVVIIGGGAVSARKAETMLQYGARVTVVAPEVGDAIERLQVDVAKKRYEATDIDEAFIVIASTNDAAVNEQIARDCRARRILVNVADAPQLSDFIVPAVIERGSIRIAISTGGNSPALARRLKFDLQSAIGPEYVELSDILGALRESARSALPTDDDRKHFFDSIITSGVLELLRDGRRAEANDVVARLAAGAGVAFGDRD